MRSYLFIGNKKCRIYAACGVSQTPNYKLIIRGEKIMNKNFKKSIGNFAINMGKHAVGKCMIPGMFDPKIPDELKRDTKRQNTSK